MTKFQTEFNLYWFVKDVILSLPICPDGGKGMPCPSCIAEAVSERLVYNGIVSDAYIGVAE